MDGHLGRPQHARADQRHPDRHHDLGAATGDQRLRDASERDRGQRRGQPRETGLQGAVVQHLLHVQGADEDEREEAAAQQQPRRVRAGERAQPEDRQRQHGLLRPVLDHQERGQQRRRCREQRDRSRRAPAVLRCLGDRVDQQHQPARARDRTERVKPPARGGEPAVGHDPGCERQRGGPDRDVQIEDVLPPGVAGEKPAGDHTDGRAAGTEAAPDPERLVALGALFEHVHHDRQGGGQHDRRAEPLNGPRCDQRHLAGRRARLPATPP